MRSNLAAVKPSPPFCEYSYESLPAEGWIRILELHPEPRSILCTLVDRRFADVSLTYEALSYVWGSDALQNRVSITCNGCILSIGANLANALTHVRQESRSRLLWVDAICINQKDAQERSLQVQRMGDIYMNAVRVIVWLGVDPNNEAEQSFNLIQDTNTFLAEQLQEYRNIDEIPPIPHHDSIDAGPEKWDMVRRLMDLAWFSRVWVLQEIGLARSAVVYYGKTTMEWSHLVEFMLFLASRADIATRIGNVRSGMIWDLFEDVWCSFGNHLTWRDELPFTRSLNKFGGQQSLIDILAVTRPYEATNQRDRIYAFLSHPVVAAGNWKAGRKLLADYEKSVDEVYLEAAIRILETAKHPWTLLSSVDHKPNSPSLSGQRPSWVPRWDEGWYTYWLGYPSMWYRAGGTNPPSICAETTGGRPTLKVQGTILEEITWSSRAFDDDELRLENQVTGAQIKELWQQLEQQDWRGLGGDDNKDREQAFSLATVAGRAVDDGPAEGDLDLHRSVYQQYKDFVQWERSFHDTPTTKRPTLHSQLSETTLQAIARSRSETYVLLPEELACLLFYEK
ncbi:MAG: hypothetical protein Q9176_005059 [Flavoplaca citrina]